MGKCINCGGKIRLATDSAWQRFFPVRETFCRQCFPSAARLKVPVGDEAGQDPDSAGVLPGREGGVQ